MITTLKKLVEPNSTLREMMVGVEPDSPMGQAMIKIHKYRKRAKLARKETELALSQAQETLLTFLEGKFGPLDPNLVAAIRQCADRDRLHQATIAAFKIQALGEFRLD